MKLGDLIKEGPDDRDNTAGARRTVAMFVTKAATHLAQAQESIQDAQNVARHWGLASTPAGFTQYTDAINKLQKILLTHAKEMNSEK